MIKSKVAQAILAPSYQARIQKLLIHDCTKRERLKVLDVGGGRGKIWTSLPKCDCIHLTIVDPWEPENLESDPADRRLVSTLAGSSHLFVENEFDIIIAIDVLEHLTRSDGYLFVYELAKLSHKLVFIYTPNGFVWQPPSENNMFNAHISGWSFRDLRALGLEEIRGHVGLRGMFGPYALPKFERWTPTYVLANMLGNLLIRAMPSKAFALSGVIRSANSSSSLQLD